MNDLISIITPTYNRAYILGTAIESVRAQTHQNWELLVIDDGGSDDTEQFVASFNDPRLRYEHIEHGGQSRARNRGLDIAQGKWITFLDSDNEFLPQCLEKELATLHANPQVLALVPRGHKTHELWENGRLVKSIDVPEAFPERSDNVIKDIFMRAFIFEPNGFIHAASMRDEGIRFDESFSSCEDWDYVMTMGEKHPRSFLYLPEVLYNYHQRYGGDGVVSRQPYWDRADVFEKIYQKHKNDRLMEGQQWYPQRVEKWRKIQADFEKGLEPPPHLYYFKQ
jgi:glycosyltransferase involved in cell wall biosynthesis